MPPTFPHAYLFHEVTIELATEKRSAGRCVSWRCRRRAAYKKNGRCNTCSSRLFRLRNDDHYGYSNLKASAAKRGIGFELSFRDFMEFCKETGANAEIKQLCDRGVRITISDPRSKKSNAR